MGSINFATSLPSDTRAHCTRTFQ